MAGFPTHQEGRRLAESDVDGLSAAELDSLMGLSDHLGPFLPHFLRETLRCGGDARVHAASGRLVGLSLTDPAEGYGTLFTRTPALIEEALRGPKESLLYAELPVAAPREAYTVYAMDLANEPVHRFRHRVEIGGSDGDREVRELLLEVYGRVNDRWLSAPARGPEHRFTVRVQTDLAGVAWVALVGRHARLHSVTVRPGFRGLGVGADLLFGRLLWARRSGASRAISEIADQNLPSRRIAENAGMRKVGPGYLYRVAGAETRAGSADRPSNS